MNGWRKGLVAALMAATVGCALAETPPASGTVKTGAGVPPVVRKIKAVDADNHSVIVNRPGVITLLMGTNEDSQDAARAAGKAMYPIQGRSDFQLIVVVDLRGSIAAWVPSVVLNRMRANLDQEAIALKPYYLKNGNKGNPRIGSHVIADFNGTICPQLGWTDHSDDLRAILFNADGHETKRWDKIDSYDLMLADVRAAIAVLDEANRAKAAAAAKTQGTKLVQPPTPAPPLPPLTPPANPK